MSNSFYSKVFQWLFIGLLVTFGSGFALMYSPAMLHLLFDGFGYIIVFILQIGLCIYLSAKINTIKPSTAKIVYLLYTLLTGLTFSTLFLIFQLDSILFVLLITAILFGIFAFFGKVTNIDLSKFSTFLFIGLIGVILLQIVNIFIMNNTLDMVTCIISIIIFLGYIAWDMQKIRYLSESGTDSDNMAIIGAFELYLDFINVFINLLRLFGRERE